MKKAKSPTAAPTTLAVVMGDIIDSERQRSGGDLSRDFNAFVRAANKKYRASIVSPLTITLGDGNAGTSNPYRCSNRNASVWLYLEID